MSDLVTPHTPAAGAVLAEFRIGSSHCVVIDAAASQASSVAVQVIGALALGERHLAVCLDSPEPTQDAEDAMQRLTTRELEIALLLGTGRSNKQIARQLGISRYTVGAHLSRLFVKFGVHTRSALVTRILARKPLPRRDPVSRAPGL